MSITLEGDGIASLILDRPKVNALDGGMLTDLQAAVTRIEADDTIQGVIIRSAGPTFSAGLDLGALLDADRAEMARFFERFEATFTALFACGKPIAAAVQGHAIAGGLVLALAADFVALQRGPYRVGLTELQVGVPFPDSALQIVNHALPPRAARKLIYEAGLYGAEACFELGVGDVLVPDALGVATAWMRMVVSRPLATFRETKARMRQAALARIKAGRGPGPVVEALLSDAVRAAVRGALRR